MNRKQGSRVTKSISISAVLFLAVLSGCGGSSDVLVEGEDQINGSGATVTDEVQEQNNTSTIDEAGVGLEQTPSVDTTTDNIDTEVEVPDEAPVELNLEAGNRVIERVGQLYIAQTNGPVGIEVKTSAQFHRLIVPLEDGPLLREQEALDTCEIGSVASQLSADTLAFPIDHLLSSQGEQAFQVSPTLVGESIDISSSEGSYAMLNVVEADAIESSFAEKDYQMQTGAALTTAVPDELAISVSGANFPLQWSWQTPPLLATPLRDAVRQIEVNPVLTWQGIEQSQSRQSRLMLYAGYIDEVTGNFQSFECVLEDDGEFIVPDDIRALFTNGFTANFVDLVRYTRTLHTVDDIGIVNVFVQKF